MFAAASHPLLLQRAAPALMALAILLGIIGTAKWKTDRTVAKRLLVFAVILLLAGIWIDIYLVSLS